jgi:Domain of unknown function (DUF6378)
MTAERLLAEAAAVVRDRRHTYGQPLDLFKRVATRWSQVLGITATPAQAILCLIDLKVARLSHDPLYLDSITDIAGYSGCLAEVLSDRELRGQLRRHQPTRIDPEAEKRAGWCEHGFLVVAEEDRRLTWPEREMVRQLGARLYGQRRSTPDG